MSINNSWIILIHFLLFIVIINFINSVSVVKIRKNSAGISNNSTQNCLFIGCLCTFNYIKCPAGYNDQESSSIYDYSNKLTMFPKRTNFYSSNLKLNNLTINLRDNYLEMIPDDRFSGLGLLKLDLSNNSIYKLSTFVFRDMTRLDILDLSHNKVSYLSSSIFSPIETSLHVLNLDTNCLNELG